MVSSSFQVLGDDIVLQRQQAYWRPIYIGAFIGAIVLGAIVSIFTGGLNA